MRDLGRFIGLPGRVLLMSCPRSKVLTGIDVLARDDFKQLAGYEVGPGDQSHGTGSRGKTNH